MLVQITKRHYFCELFYMYISISVCSFFVFSFFFSLSFFLLFHMYKHASSANSALFSQLMDTAEPWFSSFEREVRRVSLIGLR